MSRRHRRPWRILAGVLLAAPNAYLLVLLAAAARARRTGSAQRAGEACTRFVVVVPAHDEEESIGRTLESLAALDYPAGLVEVIVLADNCSDATAQLAGGRGATVWERSGGGSGGKGAALAWGLGRITAERPAVDAVAVVDADCLVAPNLLAAFDARIRTGATAVQASYQAANPSASAVSGLRYASLALVNHVRPLGKAALGLSPGLFGTGMAFSSAMLSRLPWTACSLVEDQEYHLELVAAGERVAFAPETCVQSAMPVSLRASRSQQARWDAGRGRLLRSWTPRLLAEGARRRDPARLNAALEPLVPPQSLLLAGNVLGAAAALRGPRRVRRLALANLGAQAVFVGGGLALVRAPAAVWRSLALAPVMAVWKLGLLVRLWTGRGPTRWERTERRPSA